VNFLELEPTAEQAQSNTRRLIFAAVALLAALLLMGWYVHHLFRFSAEKHAVEQFLDALAASDTTRAYPLWSHTSSYKMEDFLADWGPKGYYGPVKSYRIKSAKWPRDDSSASGVTVTVEISPFSPFPAPEDVEKSRRTKLVTIWVETKTKSPGFPP
jgi:hypothetical protein